VVFHVVPVDIVMFNDDRAAVEITHVLLYVAELSPGTGFRQKREIRSPRSASACTGRNSDWSSCAAVFQFEWNCKCGSPQARPRKVQSRFRYLRPGSKPASFPGPFPDGRGNEPDRLEFIPFPIRRGRLGRGVVGLAEGGRGRRLAAWLGGSRGWSSGDPLRSD
jgi:hypothetical protein